MVYHKHNALDDNVYSGERLPLLSREQEKSLFTALHEYRQKFRDLALGNPIVSQEFTESIQKIRTEKKLQSEEKFKGRTERDFAYVSLLKRIAEENISEDKHKALDAYYETYCAIRDYLVMSNVRFVASIAKKYSSPEFSFKDCYETGIAGLLISIDRFSFAY